ncbi:hypothetical protein [Arthrobacter sp. AOP36-C1-22]|uniref:hypothetical protein n=1 Tax=Arthrobacter sp. AOP36-C1-22 TaxID=3457683 RepID=UPI0040345AD3
MTYEHELAYYLRLRGLQERQVSEVIEEIHAHLAISGNTAESEFGKSVDYAESFAEVKRRSPGVHVITTAGVLAIGYVAAVLALGAWTDVDVRALTGPVMLWPALAVLVAGVLGGFLTDYLRPPPRLGRR